MRTNALLGAAALLASLTAGASHAAVVTFNFNGMGYNSSSNPTSNSLVQTYLQNTWASAGQSGALSVTGSGMLSNNQYTGDGHVVGPKSGGTVTPITLGSNDGGVQGTATAHSLSTTNPDDYIVNSGSDRITITFPTLIYSVQFDFEIFPDGTCPTASNCGASKANWPDFKLLADGTQVMLQLGVDPSAAGAGYQYSTISGSSKEKAPQYLGVSGLISFIDGVNKLEFVDWPQRIGIDNLKVDTCCRRPPTDLPEPGSLALTGLVVAAAGLIRRRR